MGKSENEETERKAGYGCDLAPSIPEGIVLEDVRNNKWIIGKPIGSGAFGDVYLACQGDKFIKDKVDYVVKLEPHANGPLFTEMHCLTRIGMPSHRLGWKTEADKPGAVNLPLCHGFGSFHYEEKKLRFVVIDKLGSDLEKHFKSGEKPFPLVTVLRIGVQILDALEFIHSKNYVHNDIKAQNVLMGPTPQTADDVFLVDFGLACKYKNGYGFHKECEPDERRAHDGTLEYTSRDAHIGAHSRRGDLETLGYNMVHWASGVLPWIKDMDPEAPENVENQKKFYMTNRVGFLAKCFQPDDYPKVLEEFLDYVTDMEFDTAPDYDKLRQMMNEVVSAAGKGSDGKLVFTKPAVKRKQSKRSKKLVDDENARSGFDEELSRGFEEFNIDESSKGGDDSTRKTRSKMEEGSRSSWNWEEVLKQNPETLGKPSKEENNEEEESCAREEEIKRRQLEAMSNPTPEMCRIMAALKDFEDQKRAMSLKDQLVEFNKQRKAEIQARFSSQEFVKVENTPVMEEVISRRASRLSKNVPSPDTPQGNCLESNQEEDKLRKKAKLYFRRLQDSLDRSRRKEKTNSVKRTPLKAKQIKKSLVKKVLSKKLTLDQDKTVEENLAKSLNKVVLSTRTSARLHKTSPTLEKSKKLVKKAVQKSKQIRSKVSPRVLRQLRPRKPPDKSKPKEKSKPEKKVEKEKKESEDNQENVESDGVSKENVIDLGEETPAQIVVAKKSLPVVSTDEDIGVTKDPKESGVDNTEPENKEDKLSAKQSISSDRQKDDNVVETDESNQINPGTNEVGDGDAIDKQKLCNDIKPVDDTAVTPASDDEQGSPQSSPKTKDTSVSSLTETINSLAATKNQLFDSLLSEPPKRKKKLQIEDTEEKEEGESANETNQAEEPPFKPDNQTPLVVNTDLGNTVQPMFSPDEEDNGNFSADILDFGTEPNSPNFDQCALDRILSVLSPEHGEGESEQGSTATEQFSSAPGFDGSIPGAGSLLVPAPFNPTLASGSTSPFIGSAVSTASIPTSSAFFMGSDVTASTSQTVVSSPLFPSAVATTTAGILTSDGGPLLLGQSVPTITTSQPSSLLDIPTIVTTAVQSTVSVSTFQNKDNSLLQPAAPNEIATPTPGNESVPEGHKGTATKLLPHPPASDRGSNIPSIPSTSAPSLLSSLPVTMQSVHDPSEGTDVPACRNPNTTGSFTVLERSSTLVDTRSDFISLSNSIPSSSLSMVTPVTTMSSRTDVSKTVFSSSFFDTKTSAFPQKSATLKSSSPTSISSKSDSMSTVTVTSQPSLTPSTSVSVAVTSILLSSTTSVTTSRVSTVTVTTSALPSLRISAVSPNIVDLKPSEQQTPRESDSLVLNKSPGEPKNTLKVGEKDVEGEPVDVSMASSPCDHDEDEEENYRLDDYKYLSRSFSSIKQRLKSIAKDMSTPLQEFKTPNIKHRIASPLTLRITRSADGKWKTDSTPPEKLVLKISGGKRTVPKLRVKTSRNPVLSDKPCKIKISLRKEKRTPLTETENTPKSGFVPDEWVSFEQVQSKLADVKPDLEDVKKSEVIEGKVTKENLAGQLPPSTVVTTSPDSKLKIRSDLVTTQTPVTLNKPKISLRTDLFAVSQSNILSNQSENIVKTKPFPGRRNLMETIQNLKDQREKVNPNKLVVLNPVTEDLDDIAELGCSLKDSPLGKDPNAKRNNQSKSMRGRQGEALLKVPDSCYCCPTLVCRNKNQSSQPTIADISLNPFSQLEQSGTSPFSENSPVFQPSKRRPKDRVPNMLGGVGFNEFDQALATISEIQGFPMKESDGKANDSPYFDYDIEDRGDQDFYEETLTYPPQMDNIAVQDKPEMSRDLIQNFAYQKNQSDMTIIPFGSFPPEPSLSALSSSSLQIFPISSEPNAVQPRETSQRSDLAAQLGALSERLPRTENRVQNLSSKLSPTNVSDLNRFDSILARKLAGSDLSKPDRINSTQAATMDKSAMPSGSKKLKELLESSSIVKSKDVGPGHYLDMTRVQCATNIASGESQTSASVIPGEPITHISSSVSETGEVVGTKNDSVSDSCAMDKDKEKENAASFIQAEVALGQSEMDQAKDVHNKSVSKENQNTVEHSSTVQQEFHSSQSDNISEAQSEEMSKLLQMKVGASSATQTSLPSSSSTNSDRQEGFPSLASTDSLLDLESILPGESTKIKDSQALDTSESSLDLEVPNQISDKLDSLEKSDDLSLLIDTLSTPMQSSENAPLLSEENSPLISSVNASMIGSENPLASKETGEKPVESIVPSQPFLDSVEPANNLHGTCMATLPPAEPSEINPPTNSSDASVQREDNTNILEGNDVRERILTDVEGLDIAKEPPVTLEGIALTANLDLNLLEDSQDVSNTCLAAQKDEGVEKSIDKLSKCEKILSEHENETSDVGVASLEQIEETASNSLPETLDPNLPEESVTVSCEEEASVVGGCKYSENESKTVADPEINEEPKNVSLGLSENFAGNQVEQPVGVQSPLDNSSTLGECANIELDLTSLHQPELSQQTSEISEPPLNDKEVSERLSENCSQEQVTENVNLNPSQSEAMALHNPEVDNIKVVPSTSADSDSPEQDFVQTDKSKSPARIDDQLQKQRHEEIVQESTLGKILSDEYRVLENTTPTEIDPSLSQLEFDSSAPIFSNRISIENTQELKDTEEIKRKEDKTNAKEDLEDGNENTPEKLTEGTFDSQLLVSSAEIDIGSQPGPTSTVNTVLEESVVHEQSKVLADTEDDSQSQNQQLSDTALGLFEVEKDDTGKTVGHVETPAQENLKDLNECSFDPEHNETIPELLSTQSLNVSEDISQFRDLIADEVKDPNNVPDLSISQETTKEVESKEETVQELDVISAQEISADKELSDTNFDETPKLQDSVTLSKDVETSPPAKHECVNEGTDSVKFSDFDLQQNDEESVSICVKGLNLASDDQTETSHLTMEVDEEPQTREEKEIVSENKEDAISEEISESTEAQTDCASAEKWKETDRTREKRKSVEASKPVPSKKRRSTCGSRGEEDNLNEVPATVQVDVNPEEQESKKAKVEDFPKQSVAMETTEMSMMLEDEIDIAEGIGLVSPGIVNPVNQAPCPSGQRGKEKRKSKADQTARKKKVKKLTGGEEEPPTTPADKSAEIQKPRGAGKKESTKKGNRKKNVKGSQSKPDECSEDLDLDSTLSPFKKPLTSGNILERRESGDSRASLESLKSSPGGRKRRDSCSSNASSASDSSVRSRSRHESSSSNTSESSNKEAKPVAKRRLIDNLDVAPILSRRKGRNRKETLKMIEMKKSAQKKSTKKTMESGKNKVKESKAVEGSPKAETSKRNAETISNKTELKPSPKKKPKTEIPSEKGKKDAGSQKSPDVSSVKKKKVTSPPKSKVRKESEDEKVVPKAAKLTKKVEKKTEEEKKTTPSKANREKGDGNKATEQSSTPKKVSKSISGKDAKVEKLVTPVKRDLKNTESKSIMETQTVGKKSSATKKGTPNVNKTTPGTSVKKNLATEAKKNVQKQDNSLNKFSKNSEKNTPKIGKKLNLSNKNAGRTSVNSGKGKSETVAADNDDDADTDTDIDTDADTDVEEDEKKTQVQVDDEITLNITDASLDQLKKIKVAASNAKEKTPAQGRDKMKKLKKKSVGGGGGLRKGRSGTNTRSTSIQL